MDLDVCVACEGRGPGVWASSNIRSSSSASVEFPGVVAVIAFKQKVGVATLPEAPPTSTILLSDLYYIQNGCDYTAQAPPQAPRPTDFFQYRKWVWYPRLLPYICTCTLKFS